MPRGRLKNVMRTPSITNVTSIERHLLTVEDLAGTINAHIFFLTTYHCMSTLPNFLHGLIILAALETNLNKRRQCTENLDSRKTYTQI